MKEIEIYEQIGGGSSGIIYKGRLAGKMVAVKRMYGDPNELSHGVEIYSSLLPHPNIVPLLGVTPADQFTMIIYLEFADKSLYQFLHKEGMTPSLQESTKWAVQIAQGMQHIHQHGLAYCNLKSRKVLLFKKEDTIVKINYCNQAQPLEHTTNATQGVGTYRWMAPEVLGGKYNQRCDVFSYGMVLYEMFAYKVPFYNNTESMAAMKIHEGERPPIPPEAPLYIQQLMQSCWKQDPYDRPTFGEILQVGYSDTPIAYSIQYICAADCHTTLCIVC